MLGGGTLSTTSHRLHFDCSFLWGELLELLTPGEPVRWPHNPKSVPVGMLSLADRAFAQFLPPPLELIIVQNCTGVYAECLLLNLLDSVALLQHLWADLLEHLDLGVKEFGEDFPLSLPGYVLLLKVPLHVFLPVFLRQLCHGPVQDVGDLGELVHLVNSLEVDVQFHQLTMKLLHLPGLSLAGQLGI